MSASGSGPWNVLSGAIRKRVDEAREKHNAAEAQERQNEFDLIMEGVRAHAANGTLTDDMLEQAKGKMQKLVPKESHPLIDAFSKVMAHARDAKKRKKEQGKPQGQLTPAPVQGQPGGQQPGPGPQPSQGPVPPGTPVPQGSSG